MTTTEAAFSFTTKINGDLLTVRGDGIEEFAQNLDEVTGTYLDGVLLGIKALQALGAVAPILSAVAPVVDIHQGVQSTPTPNVPAYLNTPAPAPVAAGAEVMMDRYNNKWTYNDPQAPTLPDGRGAYARKDWADAKGVERHAWLDPIKGPKPFAAGSSEAPIIWIR